MPTYGASSVIPPRRPLAIENDKDNPEPYAVMAASVIKLASTLDQMKSSGLTMRAMQVLLKDATGVSHRDIEAILTAAPKLRRYYTAPKAK